MYVELAIEAGDWPPEDVLRALVERAVAAASVELFDHPAPPSARASRADAELSVLFTDDAGIRRLNAAWCGKDKPTNVLAFPQRSGPLLGDVILAAETVRGEAALAAKPFEDHIAHLVVHGFLHLLGYGHDEEADAEKMEALERVALKRLGIPDPYARPKDP